MIHTIFLRSVHGVPILILLLSTVYVPCINRISTVVNSGCKAWFSRQRKGAYWIQRETKERGEDSIFPYPLDIHSCPFPEADIEEEKNQKEEKNKSGWNTQSNSTQQSIVHTMRNRRCDECQSGVIPAFGRIKLGKRIEITHDDAIAEVSWHGS